MLAMLGTGLPEKIDGEEDIVRFLMQSNHYNTHCVRPVAFLPSPITNESSVSRHGREPRRDLWALGDIAAGERTLKGAGIFKASRVNSEGLRLDFDEPPPRHAAIRGWRLDEDPQVQKSKQLGQAQVLASAAGPALLFDPAEA